MVNCLKGVVFIILFIVFLLVMVVCLFKWCKNRCENRFNFCIWDCESYFCVRKCINDLKNCYFWCGKIKRKINVKEIY